MTTNVDQYFVFEHLPAPLQAISKPIAVLASQMNAMLPDGPEKSAGMRKLLEAKDCFVRCGVVQSPISERNPIAPINVKREG